MIKYSPEHEWIRIDNDEATVGITHRAQELLGDLVFIDLPEVGQVVEAGDETATIESVKVASEAYSPVSGEIIAINENATQDPSLVNKDPEDTGWLFKVRLSNKVELDALMDKKAYDELVASQED